MTVAGILQPSYLSWPGHFYWIKNCDIFILLDDVQYTRQDWRNRNYIKTPQGKKLLTVPVHWYGNSYCLINKIEIANEQPWSKKHLEALRSAYTKAPYFEDYFPYFQDIFLREWRMLSDLTIYTMKDLAGFLDIKTNIVISSEFSINTENSTEKLVKLCQAVGADTYLAGRRGFENYIDHQLFNHAGIKIVVKDYTPREYPQLWGDFISHLSVVDLLFNCGPKAKDFIMDESETAERKIEADCLKKPLIISGDECSLKPDDCTELPGENKVINNDLCIYYWKNEYDSHFFSKDIYSLSTMPIEDMTEYKITKDFKTFSNYPRGIIMARIPVCNAHALQDAIAARFEILCPMADLELDLQKGIHFKCTNEIREATNEDNEKVGYIAGKVFSFTRFHREKKMSFLANEYHRIWAENCLSRKQADIVLVHGKSEVNGFMAISYLNDLRKAKIVLIGVSQEKQGLGIGKDLLSAGILWARSKGASKMCVRTEADNIKAFNLYLESGFRLGDLFIYLRKDNDF